jgi:hypothetical protein
MFTFPPVLRKRDLINPYQKSRFPYVRTEIKRYNKRKLSEHFKCLINFGIVMKTKSPIYFIIFWKVSPRVELRTLDYCNVKTTMGTNAVM